MKAVEEGCETLFSSFDLGLSVAGDCASAGGADGGTGGGELDESDVVPH